MLLQEKLYSTRLMQNFHISCKIFASLSWEATNEDITPNVRRNYSQLRTCGCCVCRANPLAWICAAATTTAGRNKYVNNNERYNNDPLYAHYLDSLGQLLASLWTGLLAFGERVKVCAYDSENLA